MANEKEPYSHILHIHPPSRVPRMDPPFTTPYCNEVSAHSSTCVVHRFEIAHAFDLVFLNRLRECSSTVVSSKTTARRTSTIESTLRASLIRTVRGHLFPTSPSITLDECRPRAIVGVCVQQMRFAESENLFPEKEEKSDMSIHREGCYLSLFNEPLAFMSRQGMDILVAQSCVPKLPRCHIRNLQVWLRGCIHAHQRRRPHPRLLMPSQRVCLAFPHPPSTTQSYTRSRCSSNTCRIPCRLGSIPMRERRQTEVMLSKWMAEKSVWHLYALRILFCRMPIQLCCACSLRRRSVRLEMTRNVLDIHWRKEHLEDVSARRRRGRHATVATLLVCVRLLRRPTSRR